MKQSKPTMDQPNITVTWHKCRDCGAGEGEPCRTPSGLIRKNVHDLRPHSIDIPPHMIRTREELEQEKKYVWDCMHGYLDWAKEELKELEGKEFS